MILEEILRIEILEIKDEDFPDQVAEYRLQKIREGLTSFVQRFAAEHTVSEAECDTVEFHVALQLLESFQNRRQMDLYAERLSKRFKNQAD